MIIGITGGIGSGQSTVSQMFAKLGAEIISADKLAREIMEPRQPGYQAVVTVFGKGYLTADKRIDRKKLGDLVFGSIRQLRLLNKTVHPILIQRIKQEIKQLEKHSKNKAKNPLLILDAAILFEIKMQCNATCEIECRSSIIISSAKSIDIISQTVLHIKNIVGRKK